jgi:DNA-binding response OmpR family regulator
MTEFYGVIRYAAEAQCFVCRSGERKMFDSILVYGNDPLLLTTRRLVLEKAGFRVFTSMKYEDTMQMMLNQQLDLLILCQTLNVDERLGALAISRHVFPPMKTVIMSQPGESSSLVGPHEQVVQPIYGPETLLAVVRRMLKYNATSTAAGLGVLP